MQRLVLLVSLAALLTGVVAPAGVAAHGPAAVVAKASKKKKKRGRCVTARVGGKRTCLRLGARCRPIMRPSYLAAGLDCVGRRLRKAKPAALREGRYIDLGPTGEPTLRQARQAFDQTVADLPGVTVPKGTVAPSLDGTTALNWLVDYRDELSAAEREVLDAALTPAPDAIVIEVDGAGDPVGGPPADPAPAPAPPDPPDPAPDPDAPAARRAVAPHAQTGAEFGALVRSVIPRLAAHGLAVRHGVSVSFLAKDKGNTRADAFPGWLASGLAGAGSTCNVRIYPAARAASEDYQRQVIAHELTHCVQYESMSSLAQVGATPVWILDGTAEYVAYNVAIEMNGYLPDPGWWPTWMRDSTGPLFGRQYDAVGFWSLLASRGANVYGLIDPVVRSGSGGDSAAAYARAVSGVDVGFVPDWGSTLAAYAPLGPAWLLRGPGVKAPEAPVLAVVDDAPPVQLDFAAKGAVAAGLSIRADVVNIGASGGVEGRLHPAGASNQPLQSQQDFCARQAGCECPDGEPSPASKYPKIRGGGAVTFVGAANPAGAGHVTVTGTSLDALCKGKKKPPPAEGGGGFGGGGKGGGLEIRANDDDATYLGSITKGKCAFAGGGFRVTGSGSGFTFRLFAKGVRRPGKYRIDFQDGSSSMRVGGRRTFVSVVPGGGVILGALAIYPKVVRDKQGRVLSRFVVSAGAQPLFSGGQPAALVIPAKGGLRC